MVSITDIINVGLSRLSRFASSTAKSTEDFGSVDHAFEKDRIKKAAGDPSRREFTYFMLGGARFIYASAARLALIKVWDIFIRPIKLNS